MKVRLSTRMRASSAMKQTGQWARFQVARTLPSEYRAPTGPLVSCSLWHTWHAPATSTLTLGNYRSIPLASGWQRDTATDGAMTGSIRSAVSSTERSPPANDVNPVCCECGRSLRPAPLPARRSSSLSRRCGRKRGAVPK